MRILPALLLWGGMVCGCTVAVPPEEIWRPGPQAVVWPSPPAPPRIRYLRTLTGPQDFAREENSRPFLEWLLGERELALPLLTPAGVTGDGRSRVWIADSSARAVFAFDLGRERIDYFRQFGSVELQAPAALALDPQGQTLYVADTALNKVLAVTAGGELLGERAPPEGFARPGGLAVDPAGRLFVADTLRGEIVLFDNKGQVLRRIGSQTSPDGRFRRPTFIALGPHGELLVVDALRFLVEVQDAAGHLLGTIGEIGDVPGTFARPRGIAVDSEGHVYVADAAFDNIQIFDLEGRLLLHWGGAGKAHGQFNLPSGLFMDGADRLYVADTYNRRIEVFAYLGGGDLTTEQR